MARETFRVTSPVRIDASAGWPDSDPYRSDFGGDVLNAAINLRVYVDSQGYRASCGEAEGLHGLGASGAINAAYLVARTPRFIEEGESLINKVFVFENEILEHRGGKQDGAAGICGGMNLWHFGKDGSVTRKPVDWEKAEHFEDRAVLVDTGESHLSSDIHNSVFGPGNYERNVSRLKRMSAIAGEMYAQLTDEKKVGALISESWMLQRGLHSSIETERMRKLQKVGEGLYLGARATGAGGGGCMLFYTNQKDRLVERFNSKANELGIRVVPFKLEKEGLKIERYSNAT